MQDPAADPASPLALVGMRVAGRFQVERLVAEGGFGVVYRATQLALDRPIALKLFKPEGVDAGFQQAFQDEARVIARLKHPGIVEVYDFGSSEQPGGEPLYWMALEWLDGRTVADLLGAEQTQARPPRDRTAALQLLRPALEAMAFAHQQGVSHRDLKPANLFVLEPAQTVKVLDFGVAQLRVGRDEPAGATTRGIPAFSPAYAAPEQMSYGRTGPWTDVHALALLLTELLAGASPYGVGTAQQDLFDRVVSDRRPTPGNLGVDVGAWEPVLQKALSRRPHDRYPHAGALLAALEETLQAPAAWRPRPGGWRFDRRVVFVSLGGLAMAAAAGIGLWRRHSSSGHVAGPLRLAVLPFENLTLTREPQQQYFSDGLTEGMIRELGRLAPARLAVIARTSVARYRGTQKSIGEIGGELNVAYVLESSVDRAGDRVRVNARLVRASDEIQIWSESYDRDLKDILALQSEVAVAIARGVQIGLGAMNPALGTASRTVAPAAYDAYLRGRHIGEKRTPEALAQALAYMDKAIVIDPSFALSYTGKSEIYHVMELNMDTRPADSKPQAIAAARRALELDDRLADAHMLLGSALICYEHDWSAGERYLRRALDLDPNNADAHRWYALTYLSNLGRHDQAVAAARRAVELAPVSVPINNALARILYQARRHDEAIAQLHRTLELDPASWVAHLFLAKVYVEKGLDREATAALAKAARVTAEVAAQDAYQNARFGRRRQAEAVLERLNTEARTRYLPAVPLARVELALGRVDEALISLERAYIDRSVWVLSLRVDPVWDPLRADPRFQHLVRRVGGPPP